MKDDLFVSLRKYRPRESRTPKENFLTEAFAWVLKNYSHFSQFYLNFLFKELKFLSNVKNGKWKTQVNFNGYYPDLVCELPEIVLIFEHKLFSNLHEGQLNNYRNYANNKYDDHKIILITANTSQHEQNPDLAICWERIHTLILDWISNSNDKTEFLVFESFLRLLEFEGLGPNAPISYESILYYFRTKDLLKNVETLIKRILSDNSSIFEELVVPKEEYYLFLRNQWGRIGLELHKGWKPCVFVGVVYDWEAHSTKPILDLNSPDVVVMLCFETELHGIYPKKDNYKRLVEELRNKALEDDWEVYFHLEDETVGNKNKWHPIYIRKPLLELFEGTVTFEDQRNMFLNSVKAPIECFTKSTNFKLLRQEFINKK